MNVHLNALQMTEEQAEGEIDLNTLKKYIQYCRRYGSHDEVMMKKISGHVKRIVSLFIFDLVFPLQ